MPVRSLDHFVFATRDVEEAGGRYERLGFRVLPKMRHLEIGSCNRVVQLHGTYLELAGDLDRTPPLLRDYILPRFAGGDGMAMVSLTSDDLVADRDALIRQGYSAERILNARRPVTMPDGRREETDSRCFYVWQRQRPYLTLFLSQHLKPEIIWIPEYQTHANTALSVTRLTYVSPDPQGDDDYFAAMLGNAAAVSSTREERVFETARGERIELIVPSQLEQRYGAVGFQWSRELVAYGTGLRFAVRDLDECRRVLNANKVNFVASDARLTVPAAAAVGAVVEFVQAESS